MKVIDYKPGNSNRLSKKQRRLHGLEQQFSELKKLLYKSYLKRLFTFRDLSKQKIKDFISRKKTQLDQLESEIFRLREEIYGLEKGLAGERLVTEQLKQELSDEYLLLNNFNFMLTSSAVEIDHIILGPRGFLLIETKHMSGRMYIEDMAEKWLRAPINKPDAMKNPMKNPQKQLQRNQICFKKLITNSNLCHIPVYSAVVFPRNNCILLNRQIDSRIPVLYHDELTAYLQQIESINSVFLENSQEEAVVEELRTLAHAATENSE